MLFHVPLQENYTQFHECVNHNTLKPPLKHPRIAKTVLWNYSKQYLEGLCLADHSKWTANASLCGNACCGFRGPDSRLKHFRVKPRLAKLKRDLHPK